MLVLLLFSSPHSFSIGFRSEDWNGHCRSLVLCTMTHFCVVFEVCVWIIVRLEDPNTAHYKISNRVSHLLIFICWYYRIYDAVCLNKMFRTSGRKIGPQHKKYSSIFHCTHGVLFLSLLQQTHLECFAAKKLHFLVSSEHRSQCRLKFQSCLITEYAGVCFWMSEDNFS